MTGYSGARVLVVDDRLEEAAPVLKAFARRGVATAYFDGTPGGLPPPRHRLRGIRLAILDMVLVEGATNDAARLGPILAALGRLLSQDNGPYAIIVWTGHQDVKEEFERRLLQEGRIPRPIFTVMIEKAQCKNRDGEFSIPRLTAALREALDEPCALAVLQAWEENSFLSSTDVTNALSDLVPGGGATLPDWRKLWQREMLAMVKSLAKAEAGKGLSAKSLPRALYAVLNPLHADRMERRVQNDGSSVSQLAESALASTRAVGLEMRSKINSMLHLAASDVGGFFAGSIYRAGTPRGPRGVPTVTDLVEDLYAKTDPGLKQQIADQSIPVLIECTAACDHAQGKIRVARLVSGLLIPAEPSTLENAIKRDADFLWKLGPVFFTERLPRTGSYWIFVSARHWTTLTLTAARRLRPIARLRAQAFTSLQAFIARNIARPGFVAID